VSLARSQFTPSLTMPTPYQLLMRRVQEKEEATGWEKHQVTGQPPDSYYEEYNKKEQEKMMNRINFGIFAGLDGNDDEDPPDATTYYNTLSQAEVDKLVFLYLPSSALDRSDRLHALLCGRANRDGSYSFSGSGRDADRMIRVINQQLDAADKSFTTNNASGLFELWAVTDSSLRLNWWYEQCNHSDGGDCDNPLIDIAQQLSFQWSRAIDPAVCTAAGFDEENRNALISYLNHINTTQWNPDRLRKMDMIYEEDDADKMQINF
jgi:hypothetical protein